MNNEFNQENSQNNKHGSRSSTLKFYSDKNCYLRYTCQSAGVFAILCLALFFIRGFSTSFSFHAYHLLLIPAGIYVGILSAILIHTAAHGSFKPRWLCRLTGEACATLQLYGFFGWKKAHVIHHAFSDDPINDPHPPGVLAYWKFARSMKESLVRVTDKFYYEQFGDTPEMKKIAKIEAIIRPGVVVLRVLFWYLLLGSEGFVFFFIPAHLAVVFFFIHFNYATHRPQADGTTEILNLSGGMYYRTMNFLFAGTYFHKNHHLKPYKFNPQHSELSTKRY